MTKVSHLAIVVQNLNKSIRLMSEGFGLTVKSIDDYPDSGMKVAMMKADNLDLELIEPTGPGLYWQFRSLGQASFNHIAIDGDSIPSFDKKMSRLGVKPKQGSKRDSDGGWITDLDQETTLGLRIQIFESR